MHILVDLDSTIADWGKQYDADLDALSMKHAGRQEDCACDIPRTINQKAFNLHEGMSEAQSKIITEIMDRPGFYADLEPIEGAIEALHAMVEAGHDVSIVTSPWLTNPTCVQDKYDWVKKYLGAGWEDRVIITKDKTLVDGDILIDDKPEITGKAEPKWRHILFDQPYNSHITDKNRLTDWDDWEQFTNLRKFGFFGSPESSPGADDGQGIYIPNGNVPFSMPTLRIGAGEVRQKSSTGGEKGAKPQDYSLIPVLPLNLLAELYHNGSLKYSAHNWRKGYAWSLSYSAAMRHLTAFWNGEDIDPEMNLPHVTCATFHLFALAQYMTDFPEFDDRFKRDYKE